MSDQNKNGQDEGTEGAAAALFATRADCEAAKPADASKGLRPFEVLHNGASKGWVLARGHASAIEQVARLDGYSATSAKMAPVTKEAVNAKVMEMSDDEFKALVAARKAAKK